MRILAVAFAAVVAASQASAMTSAEFFARDRAGNWGGEMYQESVSPRVRVPAERGAVAQIVTRQVEQKLGRQWVPAALRITKVESNFRCGAIGPSTRHGRARGPMQVMPGSARALGYDPSRLTECEYGVAAGVAHMAACLQSGVRTMYDMSRCHVAGTHGWKTRLNRSAERYKSQYVMMVARAGM